jgi:hypothetical protein
LTLYYNNLCNWNVIIKCCSFVEKCISDAADNISSRWIL